MWDRSKLLRLMSQLYPAKPVELSMSYKQTQRYECISFFCKRMRGWAMGAHEEGGGFLVRTGLGQSSGNEWGGGVGSEATRVEVGVSVVMGAPCAIGLAGKWLCLGLGAALAKRPQGATGARSVSVTREIVRCGVWGGRCRWSLWRGARRREGLCPGGRCGCVRWL